MSEGAEALLQQGLHAMSLTQDSRPFMDYLLLLEKWNQAYNLTGIKDLESMVLRHLLDSLAILPFMQGQNVIDVGTGAGLPGIPLAIAMPHVAFVLLDSNGKKTRFLEEAKRRLSLENIQVVQSRAEDYRPLKKFDVLLTRAFSDLSKMLCCTQHLVKERGKWLAMKGRCPSEELNLVPASYVYKVMPYTVYGLDEERCCVDIRA